MEIVISTLKGLEEVLAKEIKDCLKISEVTLHNRAVSFDGDLSDLYKANIALRTALRVVLPQLSFKADDYDELYDHLVKFDWSRWMSAEQSFSIDVICHSNVFTHSRFAMHKCKDAIVDYFQKTERKRPSVQKASPDLKFQLRINNNRCQLLVDSSGDSLHYRGYRTETNEAPLNEVLAAGLIYLANWHGEGDLFDPMCGSGTIAIEAAMIKANILPRQGRKYYSFTKWKNFDIELYKRVVNDLGKRADLNGKIYASDISIRNISISKQNALRAGVGSIIDFQKADFFKSEKPNKNELTLITNLPYGERLNQGIDADFYWKVGNTLKQYYAGTKAWVLASDKELIKQIGLKPSAKVLLDNGGIDCHLLGFEMYEGSRKHQ